MRVINLKALVSFFGNFSFPVTPEKSLELTVNLAGLDFMPSVINVLDTFSATAKFERRLAFNSQSSGIQIIFNNDRIDFTCSLISLHMPEFVHKCVALVTKISSAPKFSRMGIVNELLGYGFDDNQLEAIRSEAFASSPPQSFEWAAKWVTNEEFEGEKISIAVEITRQSGNILLNDGMSHTIDGVRKQVDVSTTHMDTDDRYATTDLRRIATLLLNRHDQTASQVLGMIK